MRACARARVHSYLRMCARWYAGAHARIQPRARALWTPLHCGYPPWHVEAMKRKNTLQKHSRAPSQQRSCIERKLDRSALRRRSRSTEAGQPEPARPHILRTRELFTQSSKQCSRQEARTNQIQSSCSVQGGATLPTTTEHDGVGRSNLAFAGSQRPILLCHLTMSLWHPRSPINTYIHTYIHPACKSVYRQALGYRLCTRGRGGAFKPDAQNTIGGRRAQHSPWEDARRGKQTTTEESKEARGLRADHTSDARTGATTHQGTRAECPGVEHGGRRDSTWGGGGGRAAR